jgi:hypothetical protein
VDKSRDKDFLLFHDQRRYISEQLGNEPYTCLYYFSEDPIDRLAFYCGLVPKKKGKTVLMTTDWEMAVGDGFPGCCRHGLHDRARVTYDRFGHSDAEPLILIRDFLGFRKGYPEISEEFRFFHNLFYEPKKNAYLKFDQSGNEEVVIKYSIERVSIRTKEIREYLGIRNMYLVVFFDHMRSSYLPLAEIPEAQRGEQVRSKNYSYDFIASEHDLGMEDYLTFSGLRGKKLIAPFPKSKTNFWPYNEKRQEKYQKFIIGIDDNGNNIISTCDPSKLANYFGKNPDAPQYLKPVFFKREVLQKYYNNPEIFSVEDSYLRCGHQWGLRMDNHQKDFVNVYLGDLGRDLPEAERDYWLHFNIPPAGKISRVKFMRDFMARPAEPEAPDLLFKQSYRSINEAWSAKFGWTLFRPLEENDRHFFQNLRLLLNNSQSEFDSQILALTKVLIDALNEEELSKNVHDLLPDSKGIAKLEGFLKKSKVPIIAREVAFLRELQEIRSAGVAHLKGNKFQKIYDKLKMGEKELSVIFSDILRAATSFLLNLERVI